MAAYTIAQMQDAGVAAAARDNPGAPGYFFAEYLLDGSKKAIAATDTVDFMEIPPYAGVIVHGASITVVKAGTATGTVAIQLVATDVTGLTAWATDATAGTKLVKLATAANTTVATTSSVYLRLQQNTAGLGSGILKVRVWGILLEA